MGAQRAAGIGHYLPQVMVATLLVVLVPAAIVWRLAATGTINSFIPLVAIGLVATVAISSAGNLAWRSQSKSRDLLFADLMLWGWLRRWRAERRLDSAMRLLDLGDGASRSELHPDVRVDVLKNLASSLESRDPYTHGHSRRVARYAAMIAAKMDLPETEVNKVRTAAAVHDVGKLEVPLAVLNKPGRLTDEEFDLIKTHAPRGAEMVRGLGDAELTEMVAHHHERLDGSGYPSRIGGTEIPLGARIIAVADTFDALTSTRAYRPAKRHKEALEILHKEAGTQLDPEVVHAFDRCYAGSAGGLLVWPLLAGLPHRLWAPFESQAHIAGGTAMSKAFTVAATTAATGTIAIATVGASDPRDTSVKEPVDAAEASTTSVASTESGTRPAAGSSDGGLTFSHSRLQVSGSSARHEPLSRSVNGRRGGSGSGPAVSPTDFTPVSNEANPFTPAAPSPANPPISPVANGSTRADESASSAPARRGSWEAGTPVLVTVPPPPPPVLPPPTGPSSPGNPEDPQEPGHPGHPHHPDHPGHPNHPEHPGGSGGWKNEDPGNSGHEGGSSGHSHGGWGHSEGSGDAPVAPADEDSASVSASDTMSPAPKAAPAVGDDVGISPPTAPDTAPADPPATPEPSADPAPAEAVPLDPVILPPDPPEGDPAESA